MCDDGALTARQADVVRLLAEGLENRAIAETLHISSWTVRNHLQGAYRALGVADSPFVSARILAVRWYLLGPDALPPGEQEEA